jgi:FkbM family methyltransferase
MLDTNYIKKLTTYINENPKIGFDARTKILYPLLDEIYSEADQLQVKLQNGLIFRFSYRSNIAKEILLRDTEVPTHAWEPMTSKAVELAIRHKPGSAVIGGAYFGDHALIAAHELKLANSRNRVLCVEPNAQQRKLLLENANNNNLINEIETVHKILWSKSGKRFRLADSDSHACTTADETSDLISTTIDELLSDYQGGNPSLILLDIEGSELEALRGSAQVLATPAPDAPVVIVEVHRNYVDWSDGLKNTDLVRLLEGYDYEVFALRDCQSNWELELDAPEIIPLESVYLEGPPHGFNLIASKDKSFFSDNGFRITRNVSPKYLRHRDPALHLPMPS